MTLLNERMSVFYYARVLIGFCLKMPISLINGTRWRVLIGWDE